MAILQAGQLYGGENKRKKRSKAQKGKEMNT